MDSRSAKRPRESSSSSSYAQSSPPEIGDSTGKKKQNLDGGRELAPSSSTRLFDNLDDLSIGGVFDFPWLKDSLISKSEDWKFEDVFFTSFNGGGKGGGASSSSSSSTTADDDATTPPLTTASTDLSGRLLWCNLPDPWEDEYEANAAAPPLAEGMDCVWSSLLNQPLHQGSSSAL